MTRIIMSTWWAYGIRRAMVAVGVFVALAMLAGCATRAERLTLRAPSMMSAGLDVTNPYGPVTIRVDPGAERLRVQVVRELRAGAKAKKSALDLVDVYAETQQHVPGRLTTTIRAEAPEDLGSQVRVRLVVTTPRCDGVRVRARDDIVLAGVSGAIQAESERGPIDVRTNEPLRHPVALTTGSGNVYLTAPPESRGRVDAQAPNGRARVHSIEVPLRDVRAGRTAYEGVLRDGGNVILMRTERGDVLLYLVDNPMSYVRTIR